MSPTTVRVASIACVPACERGPNSDARCAGRDQQFNLFFTPEAGTASTWKMRGDLRTNKTPDLISLTEVRPRLSASAGDSES
jgi:hypothetical protein